MHKVVAVSSPGGERLKMVGVSMFPSMIADMKEAIDGTPHTFAGFVRDAIQEKLDRKAKNSARRVGGASLHASAGAGVGAEDSGREDAA